MAVHVLDNADILREFLTWHLDLGIDIILANDFGSKDGSEDILADFSRRSVVRWQRRTDKSAKDQDHSLTLAQQARDELNADWVFLADTDEFLILDRRPLADILVGAVGDGASVIEIDRASMTGPLLREGQSAIRHLDLRIDRTAPESAISTTPWIFIAQPRKTIVRAAMLLEYGPGAHSATARQGVAALYPDLRILHYPIRGYEAFDKKVENAIAWFAANPHLLDVPRWGWHWRRWIEMRAQGTLREDYERQFVKDADRESLIRDGVCSIEETVANWTKRRFPQHRWSWRRLFRR